MNLNLDGCTILAAPLRPSVRKEVVAPKALSKASTSRRCSFPPDPGIELVSATHVGTIAKVNEVSRVDADPDLRPIPYEWKWLGS
jgi:hypothetical protein